MTQYNFDHHIINMDDDDDNDDDDDLYMIECEKIENEFPDCKFSICIDYSELDELVLELNNIRIKQTFPCYCYSECKKRNKFFNISGNITSQKQNRTFATSYTF